MIDLVTTPDFIALLEHGRRPDHPLTLGSIAQYISLEVNSKRGVDNTEGIILLYKLSMKGCNKVARLSD